MMMLLLIAWITPTFAQNDSDSDIPDTDPIAEETDAPPATPSVAPWPPGTTPGFVGPSTPPDWTPPAPPAPPVPETPKVVSQPETGPSTPPPSSAPTEAPTTSRSRSGAAASRMAGSAAAGRAPADPEPRWADDLLPSLTLRGPFWAFLLFFFTIATWGTARALDAPRDWLAPRGLLPWLVVLVQQLLRLLAVFFGLGVLAAVVPPDVAPALPFVILGLALAVGWSARDLLPDLVAALVLAAERKIRPGQWISTPSASGVVEQTTLRVVWVRDATGRRIAVPNRVILQDPVVTDRGRWPSIEVILRVPPGHPPARVRRLLEDAVLVSPWAAPRPPEMVREEDEPGRWRVRARILDGRFADRFEGAIREHVEEALERGSGLRG